MLAGRWPKEPYSTSETSQGWVPCLDAFQYPSYLDNLDRGTHSAPLGLPSDSKSRLRQRRFPEP